MNLQVAAPPREAISGQPMPIASRFAGSAQPQPAAQPFLRPVASDAYAPRFQAVAQTVKATLSVSPKVRDFTNVRIFSGRANQPLAKEIAAYLGTELAPIKLFDQRNREGYVRVMDDVQGKDVYVIQPTSTPADKYINELEFMTDALRRAQAKSITLVIPHYGYARGDRLVVEGESMPAKVVADDLTSKGANHIMSMDIHDNHIAGYFNNVTFQNLESTPLTSAYLKAKKDLDLSKIVIVSPDLGGVKRADAMAKELSLEKQKRSTRPVKSVPLAVINKQRDPVTGKIIKMELIGKVRGKTAIIVDDIIDSAGTLCEAARKLKENGATRIIAVATHGILSDPAIENLKASVIDEVVVTNTIKLRPKALQLGDRIKQISIAPIIGEAIGKRMDSNSHTRPTIDNAGLALLERLKGIDENTLGLLELFKGLDKGKLKRVLASLVG